MPSALALDMSATLPRRRSDLEFAVFDIDAVVLDPAHQHVHHLSLFDLAILDACDGSTSVADLADDVEQALDVGSARGDGLAVVVSRVEYFARIGLLDEIEPIDAPPCIGCGDAPPPCIGCSSPRRRRVWDRVRAWRKPAL